MGACKLTPHEIRTARLMRRESKTIEQIARLLGRSRTSIGEVCRGVTHPVQQRGEAVTVPDHVLAERDRRLALQPRDLTAAITGDPLPGRSALEQKKSRDERKRHRAGSDNAERSNNREFI